jgi:hypothetical protein
MMYLLRSALELVAQRAGCQPAMAHVIPSMGYCPQSRMEALNVQRLSLPDSCDLL